MRFWWQTGLTVTGTRYVYTLSSYWNYLYFQDCSYYNSFVRRHIRACGRLCCVRRAIQSGICIWNYCLYFAVLYFLVQSCKGKWISRYYQNWICVFTDLLRSWLKQFNVGNMNDMRKIWILGKVAARGVGSGYTVSIRNANSALEQRIPGFQVVRRPSRGVPPTHWCWLQVCVRRSRIYCTFFRFCCEFHH